MAVDDDGVVDRLFRHRSGPGGAVAGDRVDRLLYRDATTECAYDIMQHVPGAVLTNREVTVAAPAASAVDAYTALTRTRPVGYNDSLADLCGFCDLRVLDAGGWRTVPNATAALMSHSDGAPRGDGTVVFSLLLPSFVHASYMKALSAALPAVVPDDTAWLNSEQVQADVESTTQKDGDIAMVSAASVFVVLIAGIYRPGRSGGGATLLAVACVACLVGGLNVAQRLSALFGVRPSPYNMMAFPIVLGNGVDSVLVMLAARDRGHHKWAVRSCPSIIASQMSTMCAFLVGLVFKVEHFFNFFLFSAVALCVSCALQVTLFPALITFCTRPVVQGTALALGPRAWRRVSVGVGVAALVACLSIALAWQPVVLTFEMLTNLHEDTITHRFFTASRGSAATSVAPIFATLRTTMSTGRRRAATSAALNATTLSSWHDAYATSGASSADACWTTRRTGCCPAPLVATATATAW